MSMTTACRHGFRLLDHFGNAGFCRQQQT
jgi:hypothetical protein